MADLGIVDLLKLFGFQAARSKLVRHQDKRYDIHDLLRRGWFDAYQETQARAVFDKLDRIVSFVGLEHRRALLVGVYRVDGLGPATKFKLPRGCPHTDWVSAGKLHYNLERESAYAALEHRVVIDWGHAAISWHQKTTNKRVLELRPPDALRPVFADYLDFTLSFSELKSLFRSPEANAAWRARLSAVAGVYLILAAGSGQQYVGSATGTEGIWGRWAQYAKNGHGGNAELARLVGSATGYPELFTFSVLQILPRTTSRAEALEWERRYKEKLGSRATGLNLN